MGRGIRRSALWHNDLVFPDEASVRAYLPRLQRGALRGDERYMIVGPYSVPPLSLADSRLERAISYDFMDCSETSCHPPEMSHRLAIAELGHGAPQRFLRAQLNLPEVDYHARPWTRPLPEQAWPEQIRAARSSSSRGVRLRDRPLSLTFRGRWSYQGKGNCTRHTVLDDVVEVVRRLRLPPDRHHLVAQMHNRKSDSPNPYVDYRTLLQNSFLCFSPPGLGWRCMRDWEIRLCDSVVVLDYTLLEAGIVTTDFCVGTDCVALSRDREGSLRGLLSHPDDLEPVRQAGWELAQTYIVRPRLTPQERYLRVYLLDGSVHIRSWADLLEQEDRLGLEVEVWSPGLPAVPTVRS